MSDDQRSIDQMARELAEKIVIDPDGDNYTVSVGPACNCTYRHIETGTAALERTREFVAEEVANFIRESLRTSTTQELDRLSNAAGEVLGTDHALRNTACVDAALALLQSRTQELQKAQAEVRLLQKDSDNYRGVCDVCETPCMDMLTDTRCAACDLAEARAEVQAAREHAARESVETARRLADALDRLLTAQSEVQRLNGVIAQHDLCHDLHGQVGAEDFAAGCAAEQRKLYGCAPDADEVVRLRAALEQIVRIHENSRNSYKDDVHDMAEIARAALNNATGD